MTSYPDSALGLSVVEVSKIADELGPVMTIWVEWCRHARYRVFARSEPMGRHDALSLAGKWGDMFMDDGAKGASSGPMTLAQFIRMTFENVSDLATTDEVEVWVVPGDDGKVYVSESGVGSKIKLVRGRS